MIKDIFNEEVKEGDVILRPKFSSLSAHKVIKITNSGNLVVSSYVDIYLDSYYNKYYCIRKSNSNINEHNCKLYIYGIPSIMKINIHNNLDTSNLKTIQQIEKEANKN